VSARPVTVAFAAFFAFGTPDIIGVAILVGRALSPGRQKMQVQIQI
jgi:hypothetical protein